MADHRQVTFLRPAAMNVAVAAAHRAERGTEIRSHGVNDRFAKRQPSGGVADERREDVAFFQGYADGGAQGFLAASQKNAAMDFPGAIKRGELVVQHARQQHEAEGGEAGLAGRCRRLRPAGFMHRLQHGGILPAKSRAAMFLSGRIFFEKSHWRIGENVFNVRDLDRN